MKESTSGWNRLLEQQKLPGKRLATIWVKDDAECIATQIQIENRKRRPTAANREHPDAREEGEERHHVEPQ